MALPKFNEAGDLPEGIHHATLKEVLARFGVGSTQRQHVAADLQRIVELAVGTGHLDRLVVFGSFITTKPEPKDVDVILVMGEEFVPENCSSEEQPLFDHGRA